MMIFSQMKTKKETKKNKELIEKSQSCWSMTAVIKARISK